MNTPNTEPPTSPTEPARARRRILVLESDHLIRALIVEWLGMAGTDAHCVPDLASATMVPQRCDLVLADIPAPHRAARLALARLAHAMPGTPIIAMSADIAACSQAAREALARDLGANAVLVKPFNQHALLSAIHRVGV
jgi:CheY-like chemotaxis protein